MSTLTLTIDTADYQSPEQAARLADELQTARDGREGITLRTGGGKFTADVVDVTTGAPSVWVATVEWGSHFMDRDSDVFVGLSRDTVARLAAQAVVRFWMEEVSDDVRHEGEREWVEDHDHGLNLDDPASVQTWLDMYREQFTSCWVTTTEQTIHP